MRFDELDLEEAVLDGLDAMNFLETTPVQELTIPVILEGKDIIACLSYSNPYFNHRFFLGSFPGTVSLGRR